MSRSFMILFRVFIDTGLKENFLLILNFYYCFFTLLKDKIFNNGVNCAIPWLYWSIFGPTKEIWRVYSWSEMFIENSSDIVLFWWKFITFKHNYIFFYITFFIWEVRFTCFPKWFGITINTKFLKVLQFGLFIQIWHQVSLSLKLDNVTGIFWLIWIVFETWFDNYLLPKVLIKMGFLILS